MGLFLLRCILNFLDWHKEFSIGNAHLDQLHKEIVSLLNIVYIEMLNNESKIIVEEKTDNLVDRIPEIYFEEEKIITDLGFIEIADHKEKHGKIIFELIELRKIYDSEDHVIAMDFLIDLAKKIDHHFREEDHKYQKLLI